MFLITLGLAAGILTLPQGELWGLDVGEFTVGQLFQHYGYSTHAIGTTLLETLPEIKEL